MSTWAERVHRRAATLGSAVTSCGQPDYPYRLEKVKFGVPLEEVCKNNNIPGPLLVLILRLDRLSTNCSNIFRTPGSANGMKKLTYLMQNGLLTNMEHYSVHTIASVIKKFLRKIPDGIFGREGEKELFAINELTNEAEKADRLHCLFTTLPKYTQQLLVLLFGTFRVIASNASHGNMTSEALGVSVAPSFLQSCVGAGKTASMEDVQKFKVATKIMQHIIDNFAVYDLFGRENYEFYTRLTGRILKVKGEWIFTFQHPPPPLSKQARQQYAQQYELEPEKTWLQCQYNYWSLLSKDDNTRPTSAMRSSSSSALENSELSLGVSPDESFIESCARLSVSLEGPGLFALTSSPLSPHAQQQQQHGVGVGADADVGVGVAGGDEQPHSAPDFSYDYDDERYCQDDDGDDEDTGGVGVNYDEFAENYAKNAGGGVVMRKHKTRTAAARQLAYQQQQQQQPTTSAGALKQRQQQQQQQQQHGQCAAAAADQDDDDEIAANSGKRRYRQNKKKNANANAQARVQHQRRLRGAGAAAGSERLPANANAAAVGTTGTTAGGGAGAGAAAVTGATNLNEYGEAIDAYGGYAGAGVGVGCQCGKRHSSSCSSVPTGNAADVSNGAGSAASAAAGGGGGGGNSMTLEELRAVNRYAESTKSLTYLPQLATSV